jgi:hypothetical protein
MKSWIYTFGRTAEASGWGAYQYVKENNGKYHINGDGKEYTASEIKCISECIDRLLPRKKK